MSQYPTLSLSMKSLNNKEALYFNTHCLVNVCYVEWQRSLCKSLISKERDVEREREIKGKVGGERNNTGRERAKFFKISQRLHGTKY